MAILIGFKAKIMFDLWSKKLLFSSTSGQIILEIHTGLKLSLTSATFWRHMKVDVDWPSYVSFLRRWWHLSLAHSSNRTFVIESQLRQSLILLHHVWSSMWSAVPERCKIKTVLCKGWGLCTDIYLHCPLGACVMKLWETWDGKLHQVFFQTVWITFLCVSHWWKCCTRLGGLFCLM